MSSLHVEAAGHGSPLVLLHGWALHSGIWSGLPATLARHHRVHAVDLPGHGLSPALDPLNAGTVVRALERAFGAEREPLAVLGWSWGGQLALAWALAHPQRIARLVLVATTPRFVTGDGWNCAMPRATLERFGVELETAWRATVMRFLALQLRGSDHGHAALSFMRRELFARGDPAPGALQQALDLLGATDLRADVRRVSQPVQVVAGTRDTLVPAAASRWLAAAVPEGTFTAIDGAAHAPFLSHPQAFEQALADFIDER